jgi:hypothetical protein
MLLSEERYRVIRHPDCTYLSYRDQIISLIIKFIVSSLEAVGEVRAAEPARMHYTHYCLLLLLYQISYWYLITDSVPFLKGAYRVAHETLNHLISVQMLHFVEKLI